MQGSTRPALHLSPRQHTTSSRAAAEQQQQHTPHMSKQQRDEPEPQRENLGWRATSAVPAKKARLIEGVSGKGVVELQAQLYRAQEQAKLKAEGGLDVNDKTFRRKAGIDVASIRNQGVEAREARDRQLQLRTTGQGSERLAESSAALARKAQLYDRLARGEAADDGERYEVEFWRKGRSHQQEAADEEDWLRGGEHAGGGGPLDTAGAAVAGEAGMMSEDMARERERREWEEREAALLQQQEEQEQRRQARLTAVRELSGQTQAGRAQAAAAKAAREELLADKRAALKAAFISKQVKALMAGKPGGSKGSSKASSKQPGGKAAAGDAIGD